MTMFGVSKAFVKMRKETFKKGSRVKLIRMDDDYAPPSGTKGTVTHVDDLGTIHVEWDNGSTLGVISEDVCVVINEEGGTLR